MIDYKLNETWTFYFHKKEEGVLYVDNIIKLIDIDNIKDFWGTINNIPMPLLSFSVGGMRKKVRINEDIYIPNAYSFFRDDIFPSWENCREGSEICLKLNNLELTNKYFLDLMLLVIGNFDDISGYINGIRVVDSSYNNRNNYKIEIWFNIVCDFSEAKKIISNYLNLTDKSIILYREHSKIEEH